MFDGEKIYIGDALLDAEVHYVLVQGSLETKGHLSAAKIIDGGSQYQVFVPKGYRIARYHTPSCVPIIVNGVTTWVTPEAGSGSILYVNCESVRVKVYEKNGKKFCPEFGIPMRKK